VSVPNTGVVCSSLACNNKCLTAFLCVSGGLATSRVQIQGIRIYYFITNSESEQDKGRNPWKQKNTYCEIPYSLLYFLCTIIPFTALFLNTVNHRWVHNGIEGRIILKWIKQVWRVCVRFIWLRKGLVADSCEHGNAPPGSIKGMKFLDQLSVLLASQEGLCSMELG
jgi:hypothetical protein